LVVAVALLAQELELVVTVHHGMVAAGMPEV